MASENNKNSFILNGPDRWAVIPFYVTAAAFFLGATLLLFASAQELTGHHFNPHILAIVHALVLGWGTMIIWGAAYQLLPVLCEGKLYSHRLAFISYMLLCSGTILLICCFWHFITGAWMIAAGAIVVAASSIYLYNTCATVIKSEKTTVYQYFMVSSAIWLWLTTIMGLLLAINLTYSFIPRDHLQMLKLHAHAGIAGWFLQLICGVAAKLVPMFVLGKCKKIKLLYFALALQNIGLFLFLVHVYFRQMDNRIFIHLGLVCLGTILWAMFIYLAYKNRLRKKTDVLIRQSLSAFAFLPLAVITLVLTFIFSGQHWVSLYGVFLLFGWLSGLILGMNFKTLPFIVWNHRYKDLGNNLQVPLPKDLYKESLIRYQSWLFYLAITGLSIAVLTQRPWLLKLSTILWIILALLFCYNVLYVLLHKPHINANKS